ncbi:hypothetical protein [Kitasatospora sp. MAP5-34]|uniref:hypothetical protein n=1 Tax=Kitasatospora sp. MAP5-34 TaxID=3035102 RepID=UPI0024766148|nr:hypothetical protein [Kitasatospora sp. MAP5-34]MDH6577405.1 hypothetical protein [Kitasatospora sp. MAP5-34]
MRARIAAVVLAAAGIAVSTAAPAVAAPAPAAPALATRALAAPVLAAPAAVSPPACMAVAGRPCVWQDRDGEGIVGRAQISADQDQLTFARVEVELQGVWGGPWETVASATSVGPGSISVTTPRVVTTQRAVVCATGGPALDFSLRVTTCTAPY